MRPVARVLLASAMVGAAATACSHGSPVVDEGRLQPQGDVLVTPKAGGASSTSKARTLHRGDLVNVGENRATVDLPGGGTLELAPRTTVLLDGGPQLQTGNLLVVASRGPVGVDAAGSRVTATGAVRLAKDLSLDVEAYQGNALLSSGGRTLDVATYRAASVPAAGLLPTGVQPLQLSDTDTWDRRFLADVLDHESELESRARGVVGLLPSGAGRTVGFYRRLVPELEQVATYQQADVDRTADAGEALLAAEIALLGQATGGFQARYEEALTFRAEGAPWSLVAKDADVPSLDGLVAAVDAAVNRQASEQASSPISVPDTTPVGVVITTPTTTPRSSSTTSTTTPSGSGPTTTTTTTPASPPTTAPTDPGGGGGGDPLLGPLVDPVVNLVNQLIGR